MLEIQQSKIYKKCFCKIELEYLLPSAKTKEIVNLWFPLTKGLGIRVLWWTFQKAVRCHLILEEADASESSPKPGKQLSPLLTERLCHILKNYSLKKIFEQVFHKWTK